MNQPVYPVYRVKKQSLSGIILLSAISLIYIIYYMVRLVPVGSEILQTMQFNANSVQTTAVVVSNTTLDSGDILQIVKFTVNGKEYNDTMTFVPGATVLDAGKSVSLYYNSKNPNVVHVTPTKTIVSSANVAPLLFMSFIMLVLLGSLAFRIRLLVKTHNSNLALNQYYVPPQQ